MTESGAQLGHENSNDLVKLKILELLYLGVKQSHIAAMLGVSDATISRMIPKGLAASVRAERKGSQ